MLSMESMIAISSRRGGGGRQTFPVPLSRKIFSLFVVPFMFPRPGPCCRGRGPGDGKQGAWDMGYYGLPRARCALAMTILKRSGVGGQGRPPLPTRSGNV